ncbi:MAG TPA: hypothetical protein VNZ48_09335 [Xanthobacteraceae bacterium]|nr:hypothetical protein [Xanthobacteraceae bacterium]
MLAKARELRLQWNEATMENVSNAATAMQFDFSTIVAFILICGFFGGLASYFAFCIYGTDGAFREKFHIKFGPGLLFTTLNGIIGIAGAFAIQVLLLGMRFYDKKPQPSDFIYLAAICVIGGFAARSFLTQVSQMFARQMKQEIEENKKKIEETKQLAERTQSRQIIMLASMSDNPELLKFVVTAAESALEGNPDDGALIIAKGAALKRLDRVQEAIDTLTPYIQKHPSGSDVDKYNIATAFFNRACYNALLNRPEHAFDDLKRSLELSEDLSGDKHRAADDPDFASLSGDPRFIQLTKA